MPKWSPSGSTSCGYRARRSDRDGSSHGGSRIGCDCNPSISRTILSFQQPASSSEGSQTRSVPFRCGLSRGMCCTGMGEDRKEILMAWSAYASAGPAMQALVQLCKRWSSCANVGPARAGVTVQSAPVSTDPYGNRAFQNKGHEKDHAHKEAAMPAAAPWTERLILRPLRIVELLHCVRFPVLIFIPLWEFLSPSGNNLDHGVHQDIVLFI